MPNDIPENWDLVITSHKKWYDLQLREVRRYSDLIAVLIRGDCRRRQCCHRR